MVLKSAVAGIVTMFGGLFVLSKVVFNKSPSETFSGFDADELVCTATVGALAGVAGGLAARYA